MGELAPRSARRVQSPVCAEFGSLFRYMFDTKWRCGIRGDSYLLCLHGMAGYPCIANNRLCIENVTRRHTEVSEFGTCKMLKSGARSPTYITTICTLCNLSILQCYGKHRTVDRVYQRGRTVKFLTKTANFDIYFIIF